MIRPWAALAAAVSLLAAGCSTDPEVNESTSTPNTTVVSVLSLSPGTSEIYGKVGAYKSFLGWSDACNYPSAWIDKRPIVVKNTVIDYEQITELKPSLIVYDALLYSEDQIKPLRDQGFELLAMEAYDVDGVVDYAYRLGAKTSGELRASAFADEIYAAREKARGMMAGKTPPRVSIMIGSPGSEYMAAGTESFLAGLMAEIGGDLRGPESDRFATIQAENLLVQDPQIIFSDGQGARILEDPRFAGVSAVKNRLVFDVEADVLLRTASRIHTLMDGLSSGLANAAAIAEGQA
jgi:ABC-type Fe3+-hydroxamate transport system substrate-binding protein